MIQKQFLIFFVTLIISNQCLCNTITPYQILQNNEQVLQQLRESNLGKVLLKVNQLFQFLEKNKSYDVLFNAIDLVIQDLKDQLTNYNGYFENDASLHDKVVVQYTTQISILETEITEKKVKLRRFESEFAYFKRSQLIYSATIKQQEQIQKYKSEIRSKQIDEFKTISYNYEVALDALKKAIKLLESLQDQDGNSVFVQKYRNKVQEQLQIAQQQILKFPTSDVSLSQLRSLIQFTQSQHFVDQLGVTKAIKILKSIRNKYEADQVVLVRNENETNQIFIKFNENIYTSINLLKQEYITITSRITQIDSEITNLTVIIKGLTEEYTKFETQLSNENKTYQQKNADFDDIFNEIQREICICESVLKILIDNGIQGGKYNKKSVFECFMKQK